LASDLYGWLPHQYKFNTFLLKNPACRFIHLFVAGSYQYALVSIAGQGCTFLSEIDTAVKIFIIMPLTPQYLQIKLLYIAV
jgi:hypothetical protein